MGRLVGNLIRWHNFDDTGHISHRLTKSTVGVNKRYSNPSETGGEKCSKYMRTLGTIGMLLDMDRAILMNYGTYASNLPTKNIVGVNKRQPNL
ncbi:hypothetical protein AVEN_219620-1 [Araneus ventricosus]|uniref:Uncharacterized protein n=1 Tax=Araneus ventricosus TaxID=182803 RepID=A0A4Y2LHN8_ARAVE|nr:hypothetical protein AVEN_219620-1 [Araneus ventricosus]